MQRDHRVLTRGRWLLAVLLACCVLGAFAPAARADGDPASDILVYQNLFVTSESGMSAAQQTEVANLLASAAHDGFPIRVAIIAAPVDLGAITALWGKPAAYANFLGIELSLVYKQRLLVVMPGGFGFNWTGHPAASAYKLLGQVPAGAGGAGLTTATVTAVLMLAAASGVKLTAPPAGQPASAASHGGISTRDAARIGLIALAGLAVADVLYRLTRRFGRRLARRARTRLAALRGTLAGRGKVAWAAAGLLLAAIAGIVSYLVAGPSASATAGTNPGATTALPRAQGGTVSIGPGDPGQARLYLFFATRDQAPRNQATQDQGSTTLAGQLDALDSYQLAAGAAGLPSLTAVDEGRAEQSASALRHFLAGLPKPLWYEVAVDPSGHVAQGYQVRGAPWLVLVSPSGQILWSWDVAASGWLSRTALDQHVRAALGRATPG